MGIFSQPKRRYLIQITQPGGVLIEYYLDKTDREIEKEVKWLAGRPCNTGVKALEVTP